MSRPDKYSKRAILKRFLHKINLWKRRAELAIRLMKERPLTKREEKWHKRLFGEDEWIEKYKLRP